MFDIVASSTAPWLALLWGLSAGLTEVSNPRRFAAAVRSFGVLPSWLVNVYCFCAIGALLVGGGLVVVPLGTATIGCVAVAIALLSFGLGSVIALFRQDTLRPISCDCLGGHLASDLTVLTWILPGGLAGTIFVGVIRGHLGAAALLLRLSPAGLVGALFVSVVLVLITEGAALLGRRRLWIQLRTT